MYHVKLFVYKFLMFFVPKRHNFLLNPVNVKKYHMLKKFFMIDASLLYKYLNIYWSHRLTDLT